MAPSYPDPVTPTVAAYGHVPTIELVRRELCRHPIGTLLETSVRGLARAVGRSAGQISYYLRTLAEDGWIALLPAPDGTLVEVLRADQGVDRPTSAAAPAAESDSAPCPHPCPPPPDQRLDRPATAWGPDQGADRRGVYGTHDSWSSSSSAHEPHGELPPGAHPLRAPLLAAGADPYVAQAIIAACPHHTPADLATDLQIAHQRRGVRQPAGLVFRVWLAGGRVTPPQAPPSMPPRSAPRRAADGPPPRSLADLHAEAATRQAAQQAARAHQDRAALRQVLDRHREQAL